MPTINEMFPSKYLKAEDLRGKDGKGWREFNVSINSCEVEDMGGEDHEMKYVLRFAGAEKGLPLNKTNAETIAEVYGTRSEDWIGKKVILFVTTVGTPQGPKPGIRIRIPAETTSDEIPA